MVVADMLQSARNSPPLGTAFAQSINIIDLRFLATIGMERYESKRFDKANEEHPALEAAEKALGGGAEARTRVKIKWEERRVECDGVIIAKISDLAVTEWLDRKYAPTEAVAKKSGS